MLTTNDRFGRVNRQRLWILTPVCLAVLTTSVGCPSRVTSNSPASPTVSEVSVDESSDEGPTSAQIATDGTESGDANQTDNQNAVTGRENQVLRHAVFFSFKDTSSEEQIGEVAEAFSDLPGKIGAITDFQWGTNNSPEGLDDGFTHCFLLTFKDEAGRAEYLPHADHKAFGDVLRPHMDKVFVIDYWGTAGKRAAEKELKHAVFFKFKDDAAAEDVQAVEEAFAALPSKIDSIKAFEWGKNNSPEKHDHGFTHCFMVTFDSEDGRAEYLPHDDHKAFVELLDPVLDKVRVLDFWGEE